MSTASISIRACGEARCRRGAFPCSRDCRGVPLSGTRLHGRTKTDVTGLDEEHARASTLTGIMTPRPLHRRSGRRRANITTSSVILNSIHHWPHRLPHLLFATFRYALPGHVCNDTSDRSPKPPSEQRPCTRPWLEMEHEALISADPASSPKARNQSTRLLHYDQLGKPMPSQAACCFG